MYNWGIIIYMEKDLVNEYLSIFENEWNIYKEVKGFSKISGKPKRIDAVIISKKYPMLRFGIEFKRLDLGAFNNFTAWFKQSLVYTQCEWGNSKIKLPILIAPSINYGSKENQFLFTRLIGEFGIGEISKTFYKKYNKDIYKIIHKEVTIWSSHTGFNEIALKQDFNQYLEL
jgi:hypothetical protein